MPVGKAYPENPPTSVVGSVKHHIYRWYHEGYPIGDFLTAIVRNDFSYACFNADDINRKAFYLYALFLANKIPADYRMKANPQLRKEKGNATQD